MYAACSLRSHRETRTEPAFATPCMIVSRSEARSPTVSLCVYIVIVERLVDGIPGVKHGAAAFVIQFLECYYKNAATCCCTPLSSGR